MPPNPRHQQRQKHTADALPFLERGVTAKVRERAWRNDLKRSEPGQVGNEAASKGRRVQLEEHEAEMSDSRWSWLGVNFSQR